jgi:hypothetical protein
VFLSEGELAYREYQKINQDMPLQKGDGFDGVVADDEAVGHIGSE